MPRSDPGTSSPPQYLALSLKTGLASDPLISAQTTLEGSDDEDAAGDSSPLLPTYQQPSQLRHASQEPSPRAFQPLRLAVLLLLATITAIIGWIAFRRFSQKVPSTSTSSPVNSETSSASELASAPTTEVQRFLAAAGNTNDGIVPFSPAIYPPLYLSPRPLERTLASMAFPSPSCAEAWIARGELCAEMEGRWAGKQQTLDVAWTWVNGSSAEKMAEWREYASEQIGRWARVKRAARKKLGGSVTKHFREHDELRYSLRSVQAAFSSAALNTLHLIVNDYPSFSPSTSNPHTNVSKSSLFAQVPRWLALPSIDFAEPDTPGRFASNRPAFKIHPLTELFRRGAQASTKATAAMERHEAAKWRANVLPSFNSLAVESQLPNLHGVESDTLLCLNDDFFLMQELSPSDIASPLTGPVFRFQRDLLVSGVAPEDAHDDGNGEWRGLGYSNYLLNRRFGKRRRPYLVHQGKAVSMSMLREVQRVWGDELTFTAGSRFRGKGPGEAQLWFLLYHYTIEKHREALLWSFLIARSDPNQDGLYSPTERRALLASLGTSFTFNTLRAHVPRRTTLSSTLKPTIFDHTGLERPKQTTYAFTSADGYALFESNADVELGEHGRWPTFGSSLDEDERDSQPPIKDESSPCEVDLKECVGEGFMSQEGEVEVTAVMKRVAFERPRCGDCMIVQLFAQSGSRGFEAFLPLPGNGEGDNAEQDGEETAEGSEESVMAVGLQKEWQNVDYRPLGGSAHTLRQQAVSLVLRYSYIVGESSSRFLSLTSPKGTRRVLAELTTDRPAFVALNDDISNPADVQEIDGVLKEWFEGTWPERTSWELQAEGRAD